MINRANSSSTTGEIGMTRSFTFMIQSGLLT
jgi:hypothetical protein